MPHMNLCGVIQNIKMIRSVIMKNSWGILGNPTKEQVQQWTELPFGEFKKTVDSYKRIAKGKEPSEYRVTIVKTVPLVSKLSKTIYALNGEHAIKMIREINIADEQWSETVVENDSFSYNATKISG